MAVSVGVETREIDIDELKERWPLIRTDDIVGALYIPRDGHTSPVDTTMALAKGARSRGARIVEDVAVTGLRTEAGAICGVDTEQGSIETETVVLATGIWTRQLAAQIGVNVPLQACEHFYIVSEPLGLDADTPVLRDPGNYTYFKEETGKIMAGFFEPRGKVWNLGGVPRDFSFGTLGEDWDHIGPVFERSIHRVPALGECGIQLFLNGPEAFTPDGVYYLGEAPEVDGCFVAAGFNSVGIQSAGGVGWALADWIADRHPPMDLSSVDIRRAFEFQADPAYLAERIPESLGLLYAMHWPFYQYESARGQLMSPLHDRLDAAGAVFGETAGWERPNWYAFDGQARTYVYSYGKQNWWANAGEECRAVRERVALFDQTSFAKFTVDGPDSLAVLDELSTARIDVPVGRAVYTQWCNDGGGIEADLTVTRLGLNRFLVVTAAAAQTRDWARLRRACRCRAVEIADITEHWAMIGLMGPKSRFVLAPLTGASLTNTDFPFGTSQRINLAGIDVLALRMSYVGELGWGALPAQRACGGPVRRAGGRGRVPRSGPGRLPRHEHAAAGVGLPPLGPRHHRRGHPDRGRTRFHDRLGQAEPLERPDRLGGPARPSPQQAPDPVPSGALRGCCATTTTRSCGTASLWAAPRRRCGATSRTAAWPWATCTAPATRAWSRTGSTPVPSRSTSAAS